MAAARKPALADPSSLATSVGQAGNAMCEPAALNQRAAQTATAEGCKSSVDRRSGNSGDVCLSSWTSVLTSRASSSRLKERRPPYKVSSTEHPLPAETMKANARRGASLRRRREMRLVMRSPSHHFRHLPWLRLLHADLRRREVIRPEAMQGTSLHQHSRHEHAQRENDP